MTPRGMPPSFQAEGGWSQHEQWGRVWDPPGVAAVGVTEVSTPLMRCVSCDTGASRHILVGNT